MDFLVVVISGGTNDGRQAGLPIGMPHNAFVTLKGNKYKLDRVNKKLIKQ